MAQSIWKGSLRFGLVNIPVAVYPAEERDELSFTLLDRRDFSPVGYQRINKSTGEEVAWDDIVKGYEYEDEEYVVLGDEDFKRANPEATQTVDIVGFVDVADIDPMYFDRPYYLAPTKGGEKGYAILREALAESGKAGIAKVVLRTREHLAAVIPGGRALVLELLRFDHELRAADALDLPGQDLEKLKVSKREIEMAEKLIEGMVEEWDPSQYKDEYREDLIARIDEKIKKGETEEIPEPEEEAAEAAEPQVIDIMDLLKRSLETTGGKRKSPAKARAKTRTKAKKKQRKRA
ncbi:MAG: Ku protein [Gemmatimonadota bacterium]